MIRIAIIGMGLIGTSLGMALRSADDRDAPLGTIEVVGFDEQPRAVKDARGRLAIDREARTLEDAVRDAHIIVLATPVKTIEPLFARLSTLLPAGVVVTDTASTKAQVLEWSQRLPSGVDFVGGHPMAGREKSGAQAADPDLFKDAIYCLTPASSARQVAIDAVVGMVERAGAKPYYIDPVEHDAYVGGISHLPFLLSTALVEVTSASAGWREMAPLAASGFRDISRLASGDVAMHRDICLTNREALIRWINDTVNQLLDVRGYLEAGDAEKLEQIFAHAREVREEWLHSRPNMRPGEDEFQDMGRIERPSLFGFRTPGERRR
jgi:prephenate dehydrogenase